MTENDVYLTLCDRLLEPSGLQLGVLTQAQFHAYFLDVLADFFRSTGIVKLFSTQTVNNGQSKYVFPDRLINVESVFTSGRFIPRSNLNSIDNSQFQWRNKVGPVKVFHEDGLPVKTIEAVPAPDWQGAVVVDPSGYEFLDAANAPGTIPAAEQNLTIYGSEIPVALEVCELPTGPGSASVNCSIFIGSAL